MKLTRRYLSLAVALTMILGCFASLGFTASAAAEPEIVRDGLVAWYDGSNNSNGYQDSETTIWRDLSGNKNHFNVRVNETNYWTQNAFHLDSASYYFPQAVVDLVNTDSYTIEFSAGDLDLKATNWNTLMCSDNDEFSLFIRVPEQNEGRDYLEYKYNDKNQDRPLVDDGAAALESDGIGSPIAITFDMNAAEGPVCIIYINGIEKGRGVPEYTNIADTLTIGHDNPQRAWSADLYSIRFYDRALTPAEVKDNAEADDEKYRYGTYYPPKVEYVDDGETFEDAMTGEYFNNIIPMTSELGLIDTQGFYSTHSINKEIYGDWTGVRVNPNAEYDLDEGGALLTPMIQINYSKYCRKAGLTLLNGEDIPYAVVKLKAQGESITKVNLVPVAGDHHAWFEAVNHTAENVNAIKANGETEYLIFDLSYTWEGGINLICLAFPEMTADATVYVEEIQLFATKEEAYAYAGEEIPTKAPATEEPTTEAPTAEVTTDKAETTTEAEKSEGGCKSAVAMSLVALVAVAAACVALKKKD
ncbi:MAG: hypothetical protein IIX86_01550 [Clostridia bacterium]|nr:hypothetical protein [Clostridia bacterium]